MEQNINSCRKTQPPAIEQHKNISGRNTEIVQIETRFEDKEKDINTAKQREEDEEHSILSPVKPLHLLVQTQFVELRPHQFELQEIQQKKRSQSVWKE